MIPDSHVDLLTDDAKSFANVATIGPDGEPQNTPVWFDWDGTHLRFSLTKGRQKFRNVHDEPRVALAINDPANPYRYVEVRGRVAKIEDDPQLDFINSMAKKYLDKAVYPWHNEGDERVVVHVTPVHTSHMG